MDTKRAGEPREWRMAGLDQATLAALGSELAPSALWSLLLEVLARRAAKRSPAEVLRQWQQDAFTSLSPVDQRVLLALDAVVLAAAEAFAAVELSPLAPLATCASVAPGSQKRIVSTLRGTEVVSDPTNVLALECARRLRERPGEVVRLATSHRCVRAQAAPKGKGFAQHFRILCLATAGRERQGHGFLLAALVEQIETWLRALTQLEAHGYAFPGRSVALLAAPGRDSLADRVASSLRGVPVTRAELAHPYYSGGLRFTISPESCGFPLIDGGAFDWLGRLGSNRKLAFVGSGMGTQLAAAQFRVAPARPTG